MELALALTLAFSLPPEKHSSLLTLLDFLQKHVEVEVKKQKERFELTS